jgi:predicted P-loop ATPase/GTPase
MDRPITQDGQIVDVLDTLWFGMNMSDGSMIPFPKTVYAYKFIESYNKILTIFYDNLNKLYDTREGFYKDINKCLEFCKQKTKENIEYLNQYVNKDYPGYGQRIES